MNFLWVAIGGAAGAVARYGTGLAVKRFTSDTAWSTMTVNLVGSFAIGILWTTMAAKAPEAEQQRLLLFTGFLGAFTTFSTFNLDLWRYVAEQKHMAAAGYFALSVLGGLLLVFAGCKLGERIAGGKVVPATVEAPAVDEDPTF